MAYQFCTHGFVIRKGDLECVFCQFFCKKSVQRYCGIRKKGYLCIPVRERVIRKDAGEFIDKAFAASASEIFSDFFEKSFGSPEKRLTFAAPFERRAGLQAGSSVKTAAMRHRPPLFPREKILKKKFWRFGKKAYLCTPVRKDGDEKIIEKTERSTRKQVPRTR